MSTGEPEYASHRHTEARPFLVVEAGVGRAVVHRRRLLLEAWQLSLDVLHEQVRQVVGEAAPDDDPERREVFTIRRERVRGHLPAALPQGVRDVEDGVVL